MLSIFSCPCWPVVCLLWRIVFKSSACLLIGLFRFLFLSYMSCLYILEIKPWSVTLFANIFFQFVGCLFFFMVSFAVQKLKCLFSICSFFKKFISLAVLDLHYCVGFSVVVESRGYPLVAECRLLNAVASLVAEHGLKDMGASVVATHVLLSTGSVVVVHGLSCSVACGILPNQVSNLCLLHWYANSSLNHQRSPCFCFYFCCIGRQT